MNIKVLSPWEFKKQFKLNKINEKKEGQTYSYGCLMGYFDIDTEELYKEHFDINENDLYDNEDNEYGMEIEPHVTILYGLHSDKINDTDVINLMKLIKMPEVLFEQITLFENEKYDVLKWDVFPEQLEIIHNIVKNLFEHTLTFPNYHPHSTIAYLKPGSGKNYIRTELDKIKQLPIKYWVYSKPDGNKIKIYPDGTIEEKERKKIVGSDYVIEHKGYQIKVKQHDKFHYSYYFNAYKDDVLVIENKVATLYDKGLTDIKNALNDL